MAITQTDVKLLWGRAGGRCSFPGCALTLSQDKTSTNSAFPIGEQAHIVAREDTGARGHSPLSGDDRDSYPNLILLCPNHHTLVDKAPGTYPVEVLHQFKAKHELWVSQSLSRPPDQLREADDLIYTSLIDAASEYCRLDSWSDWASHAMSNQRIWDQETRNRVHRFRQKINGAVWPGTNNELEDALVTLYAAVAGAWEIFSEHSELTRSHNQDDGFHYQGDRFYKRMLDNPNYHRDLEIYEQWEDRCDEWIVEATRAANWLADVVRRDVNPAFFAVEGRFQLDIEPGEDMRWRTLVPQYSGEQRAANPAAVITRLKQLRDEQDRDIIEFLSQIESDDECANVEVDG